MKEFMQVLLIGVLVGAMFVGAILLSNYNYLGTFLIG